MYIVYNIPSRLLCTYPQQMHSLFSYAAQINQMTTIQDFIQSLKYSIKISIFVCGIEYTTHTTAFVFLVSDISGHRGPRYDHQGVVLPHSILGNLQDFKSYLETRGETEVNRE